jgi:hypothetical protein
MERSLSDPKLGEVRAVLERLQTFATDPDGTQPPAQASNGVGVNGHAKSAEVSHTEVSHTLGSNALGSDAHKSGTREPAHEPAVHEPVEYDSGIHESAGKRGAPAAIGLGVAGMVVILLGLVWLIVSPGDRGELSAAATPDVTPAGRAISERDTPAGQQAPLRPSRAGIDAAQDLLSKGQVQAARKQLLGLASADTADVAWMLARSYDPNFLVSLSSADGRPDIEQATRWYRIWHAAAVKQGLVPNSVSVDRIIGSMR